MESEHADKRHPGDFKGMSTPLQVSVSTHLKELKVFTTHLDQPKKKLYKSTYGHV